MNVSRRDFAVAGVFALGASALSLSGSVAGAEAADEAALAQSIETLRQGILQQDKAKLDQVAASQISYGHSDGRVETKEQFINGVMNRKQTQKSLAFPELKVAVVGNNAVARHIYLGESELDGKQTTTRIGALQVWQKQDGGWKLLARQGFRLPAA
jgi:ketosteroid isomerase-like protein